MLPRVTSCAIAQILSLIRIREKQKSEYDTNKRYNDNDKQDMGPG